MSGEVVWQVPPLAVPPVGPATIQAIARSDAVRLFVERAAAVRHSFRLDATTVDAVVAICSRLDGIPLAIELAAGQVRALSPAQIAESLDDCFRVLVGHTRAAAPHHGTLRASMDWSHSCLDAQERIVFRRLAVFVGSFSLPAAERVCGDDLPGQREVLGILTRLVDKSLVAVETYRSTHRYRLLETVRQYATQRLAEADEVAAVRDRQLEHALAVVEHAAGQMLTERQNEALDLLDVELGNLRAALDWAILRGAGDAPLRLVNGLVFLLVIRAHLTDGRRWFADALGAGDGRPSPERARALWGAAYTAFQAFDMASAREHALAALAMARTLGDTRTAARALTVLGNMECPTNPKQARVYLHESAKLAGEVGDDWNLGLALQLVAMSWTMQNVLEPARRWHASARPLIDRVGDPWMLAWHWLAAALTAIRAGEIAEAAATVERARRLADRAGDPLCQARTALCSTEIDCWRGRADQAWEHARIGLRTELPGTALPDTVMFLHAAEGKAALALGDLDPAEQSLRRALGLALADGWLAAECRLGLAEIAVLRQQAGHARELAEQAARNATALDNPWLTAAATVVLARAARAEGDAAQACNLCLQALVLQQDGGYRLDAVTTLELMAGLHVERGAYREAARLFAAVDAARRHLGAGRRPLDVLHHDADRARLTEALNPATLHAALVDGSTLTLDEAIGYASRGWGVRRRPESGWESLTPTELTVVGFVAEGLSNPEIGHRIFVSLGTVKTHLAHVFTKLGISNRAELAAVAARRLA